MRTIAALVVVLLACVCLPACAVAVRGGPLEALQADFANLSRQVQALAVLIQTHEARLASLEKTQTLAAFELADVKRLAASRDAEVGKRLAAVESAQVATAKDLVAVTKDLAEVRGIVLALNTSKEDKTVPLDSLLVEIERSVATQTGSTAVAFWAIFSTVLGLNTSKEDKAVPLATLLETAEEFRACVVAGRRACGLGGWRAGGLGGVALPEGLAAVQSSQNAITKDLAEVRAIVLALNTSKEDKTVPLDSLLERIAATQTGSTAVAFSAIFGAVLGLNTSKEKEPVPLNTLLKGVAAVESGQTAITKDIAEIRATLIGLNNSKEDKTIPLDTILARVAVIESGQTAISKDLAAIYGIALALNTSKEDKTVPLDSLLLERIVATQTGSTAVAYWAIFGTVLGLNTSKEDKTVPLDTLLERIAAVESAQTALAVDLADTKKVGLCCRN